VFRRILLAIGALTTAAAPIWAQASRADTASRTAASLERVQSATTFSSTDFSTQADFDLGERQAVSAASGGIGAYVIGDAGLYYTSNPTLASGGSSGDMYFVARGGGGVHPNISGGLYLDAHVSQEVFQYARYSSLNFSRFNAGGGLDYVFEDLGQLTASVRYEYERFLDGRQLAEFYVNNALTAGLSKQFLLNDVHSIQLGVNTAFSLTAYPTYARRNSYDFWVGWRWRIIEPLELQTYYIASLYYYPNEPRTDVTQNIGTTLSYYITTWAKVSAGASFGGNASSDSYYNYTVVNLGGMLSLDFRF
jgi:hypothetical protein